MAKVTVKKPKVDAFAIIVGLLDKHSFARDRNGTNSNFRAALHPSPSLDVSINGNKVALNQRRDHLPTTAQLAWLEIDVSKPESAETIDEFLEDIKYAPLLALANEQCEPAR